MNIRKNKLIKIVGISSCVLLVLTILLKLTPKNDNSKINKSIDTSSWSNINIVKEFSFKCPPNWKCYKIDEEPNEYNSVPYSIVINNSDNSIRINSFGISLITPQLFQKSMIKNPNYSTPIEWFTDLKAKKLSSIEVSESTIFQIPGTSALVSPIYHSFDFSKMDVFLTNDGIEGLIFRPSNQSVPDTYIFVPIKNSLLYIYLAPESLLNNDIIMGILASIKIS